MNYFIQLFTRKSFLKSTFKNVIENYHHICDKLLLQAIENKCVQPMQEQHKFKKTPKFHSVVYQKFFHEIYYPKLL